MNSQTPNPTDTEESTANWNVSYDVDPIEIRDPVAEALGVLEPGSPFEISYEDVVKAAGHSCPTAAGAFRIAQLGLDALYPDSLPVRSDIEVLAAGPKDDASYGVTGRLLSYITGAAESDGFGGLAGGYGGRRDLLSFEAVEPAGPDPTFRFRRLDTDTTVEVRYRVGEIPDGGPALGALPTIIDGSAADSERAAFNEAWHGRVGAVLNSEELFEVSVLS